MPFYFPYSVDLATNSSLKWCQVIVTIQSYLIILMTLFFSWIALYLIFTLLFLCYSDGISSAKMVLESLKRLPLLTENIIQQKIFTVFSIYILYNIRPIFSRILDLRIFYAKDWFSIKTFHYIAGVITLNKFIIRWNVLCLVNKSFKTKPSRKMESANKVFFCFNIDNGLKNIFLGIKLVLR